MPSRSSRQIAAVLCAATLVAFGQGTVAAKKPRLAPWQSQAGTHARLEPGRRRTELCLCAQRAGYRRRFPAGSLGSPRFSWSADSGVVSLDADTIALAVNDHGEIAGQGNVTGSGLVPASGRATA